jgi:PmbA protein
MIDNKILKYTLQKMATDVDKCQCSVEKKLKYELNLEHGEISLLRTTIDNAYQVIVIKDNKKGSITINKTDELSVDEALTTVMDICLNSESDEAYDIAPVVENKAFIYGDEKPNLDKMYDLLEGYVKDIKEKYPTIKLMDTAISFTTTVKYLMNSNGVDFKEQKGIYEFSSLFSAKEEEKSSSFNYSGYTLSKLEKDLLSYGSIKRVLDETVKQIDTRGVQGKFNGDVIITPDCLLQFIYLYIQVYLTDMPLISGTSKLKDKLNEQVTSPLLTLHTRPRGEEIASRSYLTNDGFEAQNMTIIENGILKSFVLTQYGANKTGLERAKNTSECIVVEPGDTQASEMIKSIDKGVLVNRVSGGMPNDNGDFSVVLKNSFYIENGEVKYPLNETMIALNLMDAMENITAISQETINFGGYVLPYIKIKDVLISGK